MAVPVMFEFLNFQPEFVEIHPDLAKRKSAVPHPSHRLVRGRPRQLRAFHRFCLHPKGLPLIFFFELFSTPSTCLWVLTLEKSQSPAIKICTQDRSASRPPYWSCGLNQMMKIPNKIIIELIDSKRSRVLLKTIRFNLLPARQLRMSPLEDTAALIRIASKRALSIKSTVGIYFM